MKKIKKGLTSRKLMLIWVLGMAGQICWNVENQWFNTFIYANIAPNSTIVNVMVGVSAVTTTFATFLFGTMSDRLGTRKPFIAIGYILWGIFTIVYGTTIFIPHSLVNYGMVAAILIVMADAIMSFFGSMGNDAGFNGWLSDSLDKDNQAQIGTALAVQPVLGTIVGTVLGGIIIVTLGYFWFFLIMGVFVIIIGIISAFKVKDVAKLKPYKNGSFWHQFAIPFNFKKFILMRELVWLNLLITTFFVGFHVYFVHLGNIFIYNYGFSEAEFGYIEGSALLLAALMTIPAGYFIKKNKSPAILFVTFLINVLGLLLLWGLGKNSDGVNILSAANIPLFFGLFLVGTGYIITMQVTMVWAKTLYPDESRGQFEGIRIMFFVLFPMIIGPFIANLIINQSEMFYSHDYGMGLVIGQVPTGTLFLVAAIITALAYIPLHFVTKHFKVRLAE